MVQAMYANLIRVNEDGRIVSQLASRWTVSSDLKVFELILNSKATFSDGSQITSHDVAYSLARHCWKGSGSILQGYLIDTVEGMSDLANNKIPTGITTPDQKTIKIKLTKPYLPFLHTLAMPGFSIVSKMDRSLSSGPMVGAYDPLSNKWKLKKRIDYFGSKIKLKSLNVRAESNIEKLFELFKKNEIDFSMGFTIGNIENFNLPPNANLRATGTLSYNHLFYNQTKSLLKNKGFRKDFGKLIQKIAWHKGSLSKFLAPLASLIPKGVMPSTYYKRDELLIKPKIFKQKWKTEYKSTKIKLVFIKGHYNKQFIIKLKKVLSSIDLSYELVEASGAEFVDTLKKRNYDLISGPYVGNFPDPDGFLEPLNPASALTYSYNNSDLLFKNLNKVKNMTDPNLRLNSYSKLIRDFEDQWSVVPLYEVNFPIIFNNNLIIPDSNYRYESELWNIFWKDK